MRTLAFVLLAAQMGGVPAEAAKARKKRRAPTPPAEVHVKPAESIEERVGAESAKAERILAGLKLSNLFDSAYLAAAVYYHNGFLGDFPDEKADADPARRIESRIERTLTPERKSAYVGLLLQYWCENAPDADAPYPPFEVPVSYEVPAPPARSRKRRWFRRARATHEYAVDLFTNEGTPVRSATRGVVVLADGNWVPNEPFSTTSQKGGNSLIVFDPGAVRFLRYAHLEQALVTAGAVVHAGDRVGTVGHTGLNASQPRHGRHLHFEVNEFDAGRTRALGAAALWALIRGREHARSDAP